MQSAIADVITSYSIHYTKLYDRLPQISLSQLEKQLEEVTAGLRSLENEMDTFAGEYLNSLYAAREEVTVSLDFSKVVWNTHKTAEDKLMLLEGWVPEEKEDQVVHYLNDAGVFYESAKPGEDDLPPIQLKNNTFARLYEAIGELYTFPNYRELDLTPFFAPFYMLFFGFCLGDAGYGVLIVLATLIGMAKAKPSLKPLFKLGFYLGLSTILMGIIGGTYFGYMLHPENFKDGQTFAPWITTYQKYRNNFV